MAAKKRIFVSQKQSRDQNLKKKKKKKKKKHFSKGSFE